MAVHCTALIIISNVHNYVCLYDARHVFSLMLLLLLFIKFDIKYFNLTIRLSVSRLVLVKRVMMSSSNLLVTH